ncbi:MAG: hypothetical protein IPJ41_04095 [Phycisphaerales bacterium]|nr:hypothetical protein [Phycisphaerales bacterium]
MNGSRTMPACLAIGLSAAGAFGQTTKPVVTWSPSNSGNHSITWNQSGNGWNVQLNRTNSSVPISVTVTSLTTEPIRFVLLNQGAWPYMTTLYVRGPNSGSPCGRVDSVTAFDSGPAQVAELRVQGTLGYNLAGGDDAVQGFDHVGIVRVTGDVLDNINAYLNISDCELLGDVYGSVIAAGGDITLTIGSAQVQGNLYGDVEAPNGDIKRLEVKNGDIGTAQSPVSITAGQGSADRIEYINVPAGDVHANITAYNILKTTTGDQGIFVTGNVADTHISLVNSIRENFIITGGDFASTSRIDALHLADAAELKIKKDANGVGAAACSATCTSPACSAIRA